MFKFAVARLNFVINISARNLLCVVFPIPKHSNAVYLLRISITALNSHDCLRDCLLDCAAVNVATFHIMSYISNHQWRNTISAVTRYLRKVASRVSATNPTHKSHIYKWTHTHTHARTHMWCLLQLNIEYIYRSIAGEAMLGSEKLTEL